MACDTPKERRMRTFHALLPEITAHSSYPSRGNREMQLPSFKISANGPNEEFESKIAAAHELGFAKGAEEERKVMLEKILELEAVHELHLKAVREDWLEAEGNKLSDLVLSTLQEIETRIAEALEKVMTPFLDKIIPKAAVIEFQEILEDALREDFQGPLCLTGPEDLVSEVEKNLSLKGIQIVRELQTEVELKARAKNFSVATRIKNWTDGIHGNSP
jgi:hypothetical protein